MGLSSYHLYFVTDPAAAIPEISLDEVLAAGDGDFPSEIRSQIHKRGCVIVRNTIPENEASEILGGIKEYMIRNGEDPGDPEKTFYEIYWSKPQARIKPSSQA